MSSCNFFSILYHQTLDPDPESGSAIRKNAGSGSVSGSALNQCGSETLVSKLCTTGNLYSFEDAVRHLLLDICAA
jgi:hypothetical protein